MKKVLIIEDEPGVQMTLEDRLKAEGYKVTIEDNGISGEEAALNGAYDIILLDLMLPGRDGFAVCQNIRRKGDETPILILTARNTDLDTVMGLRLGADDYLSKPFDMGVLLARMEALLRRSSLSAGARRKNLAQQIIFGPFTLDREKGELFNGNAPVPLNTQEFRLLLYMALHEGSILTRGEILNQVWGYENETTTRTVDVHVAKLRQKLEGPRIPEYILTVRGRGYKFVIH